MKKPEQIKATTINPKFDNELREVYRAMLAIMKEPLMKEDKRKIFFDRLVAQIKVFIDSMSSDELRSDAWEITNQFSLLAEEINFNKEQILAAQILAQSLIIDEKLDSEGKESNKDYADPSAIQALKEEIEKDMRNSMADTLDKLKDIMNDGTSIAKLLEIVDKLCKEVSYPHPDRLKTDIVFAQIELIEEFKERIKNEAAKTGASIRSIV
jgi:hypothetical protein